MLLKINLHCIDKTIVSFLVFAFFLIPLELRKKASGFWRLSSLCKINYSNNNSFNYLFKILLCPLNEPTETLTT